MIVRRFRIGPGERYRTASERLAKLDVNLRNLNILALRDLCDEAFDKEALTDEFFKKLDRHIRDIETDLHEHQTDLTPKEAFTQAQLLIERMVFLYFAQNRGWLNQEADYLIKSFGKYKKEGDGFGYYQEFLHRLFRSLAEPSFGDRLAGIPFLNGGLFDDDEFRPPQSKLKIRNETFAALFDDLLEAYNFTVREDTPLSQEVAVDPEMLGKIFESIVLHAESAGEEFQAPDKRKATGSYYTPRIVVHFICRENLRLYFVNRAAELGDPPSSRSSRREEAQTSTSGKDQSLVTSAASWEQRISRLFKEIEPDDGFNENELKALREMLSPTEAKRCLEVLNRLRTLDPAVGSGAFPVGLLHELVSLRRVFECVANGYKDPIKGEGDTWKQKAKEHFIENSLFGVDIQQQAIEICRLRLWLSLLVDYELGVNPFEAERSKFIEAIDHISQLPNLEMNFRRGDSLHDYICGHPVRLDGTQLKDYSDDLERIEKLGQKLHHAKQANTKKKLRLEILSRRLELGKRVVSDQIDALKKQADAIAGVWFGETASESESRRKLEQEIARLRDALKQLEKDEKEFKRLESRPLDKDFYRNLRKLEGAEPDGPQNFVWRLDFPHVLAAPKATLADEMSLVNQAQKQQEFISNPNPKSDGGFDLIVGNPPFVTARSKEKRELYRERWSRVCYKEFQLVCPFFALSFGLLRPNAQLGFIVSNAFAMREFGKPLLEDFFPDVHVQKIVNCDGLSFPGHGTPTCIVFGRLPIDDATWKETPIRVATRLPGGGDLLALPEESPLWHSLALNHDEPNFSDGRIAVTDRSRLDMLKWPLNFDSSAEKTKQNLERKNSERLNDFVADIGYSVLTKSDDIFFVPPHVARIQEIERQLLKPINIGDELRNWSSGDSLIAICPYDAKFECVEINSYPHCKKFLTPFRPTLDSVITFGKTKSETGRKWFEYFDPYSDRHAMKIFIAYADITTHNQFVIFEGNRLLKDTAPLVILQRDSDAALIAAVLNSSLALFWLKQMCFNKGAGEYEHRDRFEFATKKVRRLPLAEILTNALRGRQTAVSERLAALSRGCSKRGRELPSLAMRKLFEKSGEAYHGWNAALPGYVAPHAALGLPFSSTGELQQQFARAASTRTRLWGEMISRQEEMDWLVYYAYGLLPLDPAIGHIPSENKPDPCYCESCGHPFLCQDEVAVHMCPDIGQLEESHRAFRLWAKCGGNFEKGCAEMPEWNGSLRERPSVWRARLEAIRDNEHIRRIEQPVYKRRWDEQWKVSNRWMAGPVAYAQEFVDAFRWWLAEKAEWHLEHKAKGGPVELSGWTAALWKDSRVQAAWPVVADAIRTVEQWKFDSSETKEGKKSPKLDASYEAFGRFFKATVQDESVPAGIPAAVSWDDLVSKKKWTATQLKKAQAVRGKLNVPRERFAQNEDGEFLWAGRPI